MSAWAGAVSAGLLAIVMIGHLVRHDAQRADVRVAVLDSPAAAAGIISRRFGAEAAICHPAAQSDDTENLISALFALERFAVSPFETSVETMLVRASLWLGIAPPDLSYGPGQIRLSRALSVSDDVEAHALPAASANAQAGRPGARSREMVLALLEPCAARATARRLVLQALAACCARVDPGGVLARSDIVQAAAIYNAQAAPRDAEAALAHHLFNQVAYHLALHYRYTDRRDRLAGEHTGSPTGTPR